MNDERLESLAKRLGSEAAARLDVAATARKVVERLREQPVRRIAWVQQTWLRIAAALVIVLGGTVAVRQTLVRNGARHGAHFVAEVEREPMAWEEIEHGRYMPRRIRGSFRGRALG